MDQQENKMHTIREFIELNPDSNGGESAIATIAIEDRVLSLKISLQCYGFHSTEVFIAFDDPRDMMRFAEALLKVAVKAKDILV